MNKFYKIPVKKIVEETPESVSIVLDMPLDLVDKFKFTQGQHLTFRLYEGENEIRRTYSLCTSPSENIWRVGIKKIPNGVFSSYANDRLAEGDTLEVLPPQGRFSVELNPEHDKHYVAIAAGSGITPVLSIMKAVLESEPESSFTLYYGNKTRHTVMFREEIEDLKNEYLDRLSVFHIFTREQSEAELFNGRLDKQKISSLFNIFSPPSRIDDVFLCGPKEMIFAAQEVLVEAGFPKSQIHFELFFSGEPEKKQKTTSEPVDDSMRSDIDVILDGRKISFKLGQHEDSILDAALSHGADLPFACKGGVCATCKAKLTKGSVDMDINYALEDDELESGYILTCQSHPTTDEVTVNFDK